MVLSKLYSAPYMIELGQISHPGRKRTLNEDSYDVDLPSHMAVLVDGMGGADAGDIASAFVREQLRKNILQGDDPVSALKNAGQALRIQRPQQGMNPSGAGALVLTWEGNAFQAAWIGACRAYHFDGGHTQCLSGAADDASVAQKSPASSGTIQALGVTATEKLRIQSASGVWGHGHSILLCSDGLLDECDAAFLHEMIRDTRISAQEAVEQLLFHALQGNANNNITAVLLRRA